MELRKALLLANQRFLSISCRAEMGSSINWMAIIAKLQIPNARHPVSLK
jgi:hypothetical protein